MINNNVTSAAFKAQQAQQQVAFKGNDDFNPGKAAVSAIMPGAGQIAKGEYTKGLLHFGIAAGVVTAVGAAFVNAVGGISNFVEISKSPAQLRSLLENLKFSQGGSLTNILIKIAPMAITATSLYSAFDAFKPKATPEE